MTVPVPHETFDLRIRRGIPGRDSDRRDQHRQQRRTRVYHTGTNKNAHNTPLFEYMFDLV